MYISRIWCVHFGYLWDENGHHLSCGADPDVNKNDPILYSMSFEDEKIKHITKIWYFNV